MLRVSGQMQGAALDVAAVSAGDDDHGVAHASALLAFTDAVMRGEPADDSRRALRACLTPAAFIDAAAIVAAFNTVDRVADATGIPLDPMLREMSADIRAQLGVERFASAANTPTAG